MLKSSLITIAAALLLTTLTVLITPWLVPVCLAPFLGLAAGVIAGTFNKPASSKASLQAGAINGVAAGIGAALGHFAGATVNLYFGSPTLGNRFISGVLGLPTPWTNLEIGYYGGALCYSLVDLVLLVGLGLLGGLLWWQFAGRKAAHASMA